MKSLSVLPAMAKNVQWNQYTLIENITGKLQYYASELLVMSLSIFPCFTLLE